MIARGGIYGDFYGDGREVVAQQPTDTRACTCHPDDNPPKPCPQKHALTHCRAADIGRRLRRAITTAMNDDYTKIGSEERRRHCERLDAMSDAAAFLEDRW